MGESAQTRPPLDRAAGLLGLASRAGQISSGEDGAIALIRAGKAAIALMDAATGPNTSKRLIDACGYRNVTLSRLPEGMLGKAIGKANRMVAAVQKGSLADSLSAALKGAELVIKA
ncbi:MAG: ribosomal L7Ae/L30e/S12e/Gadd45 family protein [Oscillospiraceae bacterium]|jgi:ribosomal protein L7Ae-like RNA K-turn-binding protein|nr:ribosomal L7Ae/L30e/S12e/Gadd45 family protein [Oscillospiraceae bacterium]